KTRLESSDLPWRDEPFATAVKMAAALDGFPRHPQMHPCGVVLSRDPILDLTPVFHSAKGYPTTHFDMDAVEAVGLVKMDILAQAGLAVMRDATAMLRERGVEIDLKELEPWEDSAIWEMVARGEARGVHHIESPAMTSLAKMSEVRDIDRLIALVSVIRPGAANNAKKVQFARRLHGLEPVEYPHPSLEPVLASTYGVVAYEEHILQICEAFAGMDAGRADLLRRALTKEQPEKITPLGRDFCEAARALGRSQADIEAVWTLVAGFQGYAFCRAHSTAYGVEAYQAAYLKRYHPAEFLSCVLTHGKGFYDRLTYTLESRRLGMTFAPPDVNESSDAFSVEREAGSGKRIRVPRTVIKEMTEATLERWRAERARGRFDSIEDFYARVRPGLVEMTNLVRLGAFDSFGAARTEQFWKLRHLANWPMERGQAMLFSREPFRLPEVPLAEPTRLERLRAEMELLSFTVSGHPLELYPDIPWSTYCPVAELGRHRGERVTIAGLIIADRLFHQVDGREMKFLTICDPSGMIEAELFASVYRRYGLTTVRYPVVEITATVQPFEQTKSFSLNVQEVRRPRGWTGWAADAA
ncbi:MAG: DNA polymerase III subunit alpha, partial [Verrucomicrobiae bacterium]|nr:DNA polymerase III subunit alpha [Verrucomicrobiae bacterium]